MLNDDLERSDVGNFIGQMETPFFIEIVFLQQIMRRRKTRRKRRGR